MKPNVWVESDDSDDWILNEHLPRSYWEYYHPDYPWTDDEKFQKAILQSRRAFDKVGFSALEIDDLVDSGYIVAHGTVIDRYYGGLLRSCDLRTRFPLERFNTFEHEPNGVTVYRAQSMEDLRACIDNWSQRTGRRLLFRGQTESYKISRPRPNPSLMVESYGEISLMPSLWRKMYVKRPSARQYFRGLANFEWLKVLQSTFDQGDIERRIQEARDAGEWIYSAQDMEDSNDPILSKLGRIELDLMYGASFNLATSLQTLLQHYGLVSPVLDLTTDLDVAIFFATNRYRSPSDGTNLSGFDFVGSNSRKAVIYVIRENPNEMEEHEHKRMLDDLNPLRPLRQSCVVCRSGPDALNLAADFLLGVIALDFDTVNTGKYHVGDLFPGPSEDKFLAALQSSLLHPEHLTAFSH